jgi:hypothetical protein
MCGWRMGLSGRVVHQNRKASKGGSGSTEALPSWLHMQAPSKPEVPSWLQVQEAQGDVARRILSLPSRLHVWSSQEAEARGTREATSLAAEGSDSGWLSVCWMWSEEGSPRASRQVPQAEARLDVSSQQWTHLVSKVPHEAGEGIRRMIGPVCARGGWD